MMLYNIILKRLKVILSFLLIVVFAINVSANELDNDSDSGGGLSLTGFSGGMMIHSGYLFSNDFSLITADNKFVSQQVKGAPFGMGGCLRVHLGQWLRVGMEGYVTNLHYGLFSSYTNIGWGGALVDCPVIHTNRFTLFFGTIIGGGSYKHISVLEETPLDYNIENGTSFRKYSMCLVDPFVGAEIHFTRKIHLIFKVDYLLNVSNHQDDYATGPRFFIGIMFHHPYKQKNRDIN